MELLPEQFPHIAEQIFEQLDNKNLSKCREVNKSWKNFIDNKNYTWIRIVNIPTVLKKGNSYAHLAAKTGQIGVLKHIPSKGPYIYYVSRYFFSHY